MDNTCRDIAVGVVSFQSDANDPNTILYSVEISYKHGKSWLLLKRYSHFEQLNKQLMEYFGDSLPSLPKKSYLTFFVGKTQDDLEERRLGLDQYMKNVCSRSDIISSIILREFLDLDKHTAQQIVEVPKMICEFKGFIHGVRDFALDGVNGLLYIVNSDMNVLTRFDAYMTNMKMPWESEKGEFAMVPVGCLECWIRDAQGEYTRTWTKTYNSQAMCIYWDPLSSSVLVGLDSGSINLLTVSKEQEFKKYTESIEVEIHMDRIMGLYLDGVRSLIHSVSKDKKYRVLNLKQQSLVADYEPGEFELTYLLVEPTRKKSFVGDRCGSIYIFDIEPAKPVSVVRLQTTIKFIRGICVDNVKCFLFAVGQDEGELVVFDINKPGRERETKEVAKLKNRSKSREICWSPSRGEIFVGNEDGSVTVWDARKTAPIFILRAHYEDITKLVWLEDDHTLLTGGKDKSIKAWKLPTSWFDREKLEKDEKDAEQVQRQQPRAVKKSDSDEEDLGSWHK